MCNMWSLDLNWSRAIKCIALAVAFCSISSLAAQTRTRPISEFLAAQGTYCFPGDGGCLLFVPPLPNFLGWSQGADQPIPRPPVPKRFASVDYAGIANAWLVSQGLTSLGTDFRGTVTVRPLDDGRAEFTVLLHTTNALTWVIEGFDNVDTAPLLFGSRPADVLLGSRPSVGDSFFQVVFINNTPNDPLPDIMQLAYYPLPGQELRFLSFRARAEGELTTIFGVPPHTPGQAIVVQTGVYMTRAQGAVSDRFPAEIVDLKILGR